MFQTLELQGQLASPQALSARPLLVRALLSRLAEAAPDEHGRAATRLLLRDLGLPGDGYAEALLDLLAWLGIIRLDRMAGTAEVATLLGGYALRLLSELLAIDSPLVGDWLRGGLSGLPQRLEHPTPQAALDLHHLRSHTFGRGVDLIAALELRRSELVANPEPLRVQHTALGLVVRRDRWGRRSYLLSRDSTTRLWQLLGGRCEAEDETLRQTLLRELGEELACGPLSEPEDATLSRLGQPFAETRLSPTCGLLTRTCFQAFLVRFTAGLPPLHADLRWVLEDELRNGVTADGALVDSAVFRRLATLPNVNLDALPFG